MSELPNLFEKRDFPIMMLSASIHFDEIRYTFIEKKLKNLPRILSLAIRNHGRGSVGLIYLPTVAKATSFKDLLEKVFNETHVNARFYVGLFVARPRERR
jgi:hypothetical protein